MPTVTKQVLQSPAIFCFDAHAGIERKAAVVLPGAHGLGVFALEQAAPGQRTQQPMPHLGLDFTQRL